VADGENSKGKRAKRGTGQSARMVVQLFVALLFVAYTALLIAFIWWALVARFGSHFLEKIRAYLRERKASRFRINRKA
jgi:hypothetical protein